MLSVDRILERVTELPFSPVAAKILELARDDRIGGREIARIITQDQAFTARLLKIANSPYYGQSRAVTTVTQAVPVLGIDTISSLAMALASFATLAHDDEAILSMRELWEHSIGCAIWARSLARSPVSSRCRDSLSRSPGSSSDCSWPNSHEDCCRPCCSRHR